MAFPIIPIVLSIASNVGATVLAGAMRAFTAKFFIRMAIKWLDGYVKRTETKWDDNAWPDFRKGLLEEIGDK